MAPTDPADLVPPPSFANATFASYRVNPDHAGQAEAVAEIQRFALAGRRRLWHWHRRGERAGLYLDGGFGVGKTHLLAACFHAATGTRRYLSFAEAIGLAVVTGPERAIDLLTADLVCIDEFELDDPSNTRLIDLLLDGLISRGSRVITTSNTVPGELGEGRMFVDQFRAQLVRISNTFDAVHVPGEDYRRRFRSEHQGQRPAAWGPDQALPEPTDGVLVSTASELSRFLAEIPIISLRRLTADLTHLAIADLEPFHDQLDAIRFVQLIDRCYDWDVPVTVRSTALPDDLFLPEYRELGYRKKYLRCQSRLQELCHRD